jgi:phage-related protein
VQRLVRSRLDCDVGSDIDSSAVGRKKVEEEKDKPLVWLHGEVKTPPFSKEARVEVGSLLRRLQQGESLSLPQSRPMPVIGKRCHELRIVDQGHNWRIVYRTDADTIVIGEVFDKKTRETPQDVIDRCKDRFRRYDQAAKERSRK